MEKDTLRLRKKLKNKNNEKMKKFGCIMSLFVMGFLLFHANCAYSAEPTKIKVGEKVNVDFLHHKNLRLNSGKFEINYVSIHRCYLSKDTFACYITFPLSNDGLIKYKKNEFKWDGAILAIPKKKSKYGDLFTQKFKHSPMTDLFVNNDSCVANFDLYMYYIPFDNLYLEGYFYSDEDGNPIPHYYLREDGKISILKYENKAWVKIGETWTDGGNWEGISMEDAKKILFHMYGH